MLLHECECSADSESPKIRKQSEIYIVATISIRGNARPQRITLPETTPDTIAAVCITRVWRLSPKWPEAEVDQIDGEIWKRSILFSLYS